MFFFVSLVTKAQYPFEKIKSIKFKEYKGWKTIENPKDSLPMLREILISEFDTKKTILKIEQTFAFSLTDSIEYSILKVYRNNRMVNRFEINTQSISEPLPIYVEDINGDGLKDLKIIFPNYGCGNYNVYCQTAILFQNKDQTFKEFIYTDMYENFENRLERDFNNDGKYEIITQSFQNFGKHNYWLFNIYNYTKGKFVNVNYLADYPIMIPLNSHNVTTKISKKKRKEFEIKSPLK